MLTILLITAILIFSTTRHLTYLHIFQQQEYYNDRFLSWIFTAKAFDKRLSSSLVIIYCLGYVVNNNHVINNITASIITAIIISLLIFSYFEKNPIKTAKKKLVLTNRAKRIYYFSLIINLLNNIILFRYLKNLDLLIIVLLAIQLIPIYLVLANLLLIPIENKIQQKFWQQAKQKLNTNKPYIIGITGSFGKTSVKHFLGHILQYVDHTLITPGSINTTMGISRIIREQLNTSHRYFIVEMGAYGIGSINNICKLTTPNMGIITNIGKAHYERFKTLDTVATAKFELATAAIKNNSKIIISEQALNTDYAKQYTKIHHDYFEILNNQQLSNITQLKTGLAITLNWRETNYQLEVPIFGLHNATNITLAFIAACELGIPPTTIITALKSMPQINHRLEVLKQNNCTIIDDAYNANPNGFKSALELLNFLHCPPGRRILITPGLIELGTEHNAEHLLLGQTAARYTDLVIVVKPQRIPTFINGFKELATEAQQIIQVASFSQAKEWLNKYCQVNDTILLANDLPDLYETGLKI